MTRTCSRLMILATSMTSFACGATASQTQSTDTVEAIWRAQQFTLHVSTFDSYYTCSGLETKIVAILEAVGARNVSMDLTCNGLTRNAVVEVAAQTPVLADEETLRAASTFDARAELVARVRGETLPTADMLTRFPAEWRTVSLKRNRLLDPQDCDLVRNISDQILPHLSVRIVKKQMACPHMSRGPALNLTVEALTRRA